jgi:23S rRNA pseudouridine1911/1915/1917 synthase
MVNGREIGPASKVYEGQTLSAEPLATTLESGPAPYLFIVTENKAYAALNKPAGLHSAAIAGLPGPCAEALLPKIFPGIEARLLNRLDALTSGLLLVAKNPKAAKAFAALGGEGVRKEYLAVVHGRLDEELSLRFMLDTDDRKRTRVVPRLNQDERGWTKVTPEAALAGDKTLVRVRIAEGARHQIRAHLAFAGLPIVGDPLYGLEGDTAPRLYLHHAALSFQGFKAEAAVDWPNPETLDAPSDSPVTED